VASCLSQSTATLFPHAQQWRTPEEPYSWHIALLFPIPFSPLGLSLYQVKALKIIVRKGKYIRKMIIYHRQSYASSKRKLYLSLFCPLPEQADSVSGLAVGASLVISDTTCASINTCDVTRNSVQKVNVPRNKRVVWTSIGIIFSVNELRRRKSKERTRSFDDTCHMLIHKLETRRFILVWEGLNCLSTRKTYSSPLIMKAPLSSEFVWRGLSKLKVVMVLLFH